MPEPDVTLCAPCGERIQLMADVAEVLEEPLSLKIVVEEVCRDCLELIATAVD